MYKGEGPAANGKGEKWTVKGKYTSDGSVPRLGTVKHYGGSQEVYVGIGPMSGKAKGAITYTPTEAEKLADAIYEAAENARECGGK